jgi:hypothetical protein
LLVSLSRFPLRRGTKTRRTTAAQQTVDHWYHVRDPLAPATRNELTGRVGRRAVRLIDVHPEIKYRAAHISGR